MHNENRKIKFIKYLLFIIPCLFLLCFFLFKLSKDNIDFILWFKHDTKLIVLAFIIYSLMYIISNSYDLLKFDVINDILTRSISVIGSNILLYILYILIKDVYFGTYITDFLILTIISISFVCIFYILAEKMIKKHIKETKVIYVNSKKNKDNMIVYTYKQLYKKLANYDVVVILEIPEEEKRKIIEFCFLNNKVCYFLPSIKDILSYKYIASNFSNNVYFYNNNKYNEKMYLIVKRIIDIFVSIIGLIILLPLFLIIAILVKLCDKGSIIYKQKRLTINGKEFFIYKFRTMKENYEKSARLVSKNDSNITSIGKILRNLHLDELPQLVNVLKGDMSLIGPRPERPELALEYEKELPEFRYRLKVKAGLTGYAQVYGDYYSTPLEKLKLDLIYINSQNLFLDFKILLLTIKLLWQKDGDDLK